MRTTAWLANAYVSDVLLKRHDIANDLGLDRGGGDHSSRKAHVEDDLHDRRWQGVHVGKLIQSVSLLEVLRKESNYKENNLR
jgi:hypothetical protein